MRIKNLLSILALMVLMLSSCGSDNESARYRIDYLAYQDDDSNDDEYGLLGPDGKSLSLKFEDEISPVINGYFTIAEKDGMGICRLTGNSYEKIASDYFTVGVMNDGLIPACKWEKSIQVLDERGNVKYHLSKIDDVDVWNCYSYSCGLMRVELLGDRFVYLDKDGQKAFDKTFEWATDFDNGYAVVGVGNKKYHLIDTTGETVLSFVCEDADDILFSGIYHKLAAKDDDKRYSIYDFDGTFTLLPKLVKGIYALLEDKFIFEHDDKYGLMAYDNCKELIMAKYEQLVPNGRYFLAIREDNDDIVKVLDESGAELATLDGEEIAYPPIVGFSFPNIIERSDDQIYLVDKNGKMLGSARNYDFGDYDLEYATMVHNMYYPFKDVVKTIMDLCGDGRGTPNGQGAFFYRDGSHCHSYEINYFKDATDMSRFKNKYSYQYTVESGVNYCIDFTYGFDEPIVRASADSLNLSAWLMYMEVQISNSSTYISSETYARVKSALQDEGCQELASGTKGYIMRRGNYDNLLIVQRKDKNKFTVRMCRYEESTVSYWRGKLQ